MPLVADFDASSTISLHSSGDSYINTSLTDVSISQLSFLMICANSLKH